MIKIAVFGFYGLDRARIGSATPLSPVRTRDFMRAVWAIEPAASRVGDAPEVPGFVKLTTVTTRPVYVQSLSDHMAMGAGLLNCDGYIAIIDAVKILAPNAIQNALRRLYELHPRAELIIAAARQNEPDALAADEMLEILGLNPALLVMPYDPDQPATVERVIRRMVRYIDNPARVPPPIFAGEPSRPIEAAPAVPDQPTAEAETRPAAPRIHGLDHAAIIVSDLDRALAFYQGLLGFRLVGHLDLDDERGRTLTHLDTGRGLIELVSFAHDPASPTAAFDETRAGIPHIALRVTGLDALIEPLVEAGVPMVRPPSNTPYGARVAFFTDPDGTLIEFIEGDIVYLRR